MLEKRIEQRLGRLLHRRGALFYKFVSPGRPGVPDRIAVLPGGRVVFIELKTDTGRVSKLQNYEMGKLALQGAEVYVVREGSLHSFVETLFAGYESQPGIYREGMLDD